uniref:Uncharacterized protein n=1 Tax=Oryza punctata TaxID=4537 RepID=A0A0E0K2I2_ORYPU
MQRERAMQMEASAEERRACACACVIILAVVLFVGMVSFLAIDNRDGLYSAAIDAVSGLDPVSELGRDPTLDPTFDLTVRIKSRSWSHGNDCFEPGTAVEVTYRGVLLASGPVEKFCSGAKKTKEQHVVAWGTGVRLPGFALDALVADARRGAEAFDVAVKMPSKHRGNVVVDGTLISCKERRVGDAAALETPCDVSRMNIPVPSPTTGRTQTGAASPTNRPNGTSPIFCCVFIFFLCAFVGLIGYGVYKTVTDGGKEVEYSVAINAVHGLGPATELSTEHTLDPEFDLTVRVSAYSRLAGAECIEPGTTVEVSYHGVLLASAPVDKFCAGVKETKEQHVVAWGTGVHLPRFAVDALVEDARRGAEAFDLN